MSAGLLLIDMFTGSIVSVRKDQARGREQNDISETLKTFYKLQIQLQLHIDTKKKDYRTVHQNPAHLLCTLSRLNV